MDVYTTGDIESTTTMKISMISQSLSSHRTLQLSTAVCLCPGNNLTGVAAQFATQDQINATQVEQCIAIFNIKICYYDEHFIPISSKLKFFAMQNFESKLFPACVQHVIQ